MTVDWQAVLAGVLWAAAYVALVIFNELDIHYWDARRQHWRS